MTNAGFTIPIILLFAHMLSDFPFQSNNMAKNRNSEKWKEILLWNFGHALVHLVVSFVSLLIVTLLYFKESYINIETILFLLLLSFFHFIIDLFKSGCIFFWPFKKYSISLFLIDQVMHFLSIIWISYCLCEQNQDFPDISEVMKKGIILNSEQKFILALSLIIAGLWGIGIFIRIVFNYMEKVPYKKLINKRVFIQGVTVNSKKVYLRI